MVMTAGEGGGISSSIVRPKQSKGLAMINTLQPQYNTTPAAPTASSFQKAGMAIAPVQNYQPPSAPSYTGPVYSTPGGGYAQGNLPVNGGGQSAGMAATPARPRDYSSFTDQEAATDSAFMDQKSAYANALKKFIEDNDRQIGVLDQDAGIAQKGIERNKTNGLTGLSEDFASRGLSNSGMFRQELDNASDQYGKQKEQVVTGLKNAKDDLGFRRAKYEQENGENGTNIQAARREAFARLAASQGLS